MDPDYIPPPPAYSEQEFDQKISQATTLSLHTSQANIDADGWPQYDPAAFEAISASEGSSTSPTTLSSSVPMETSLGRKGDYVQHGDLPSIVPLRIEKKSQKKSLAKPPAISQPRNENSCLTIGENPSPTLLCSGTSSLPARSLVSNHDSHYQQHVDPRNVSPSQSPRHSLPVQSRPRFVPQERPMSSYPSPDNLQSSYVPHLDFNPSIAYGRTQPTTPSSVKNVQYDPHAFYKYAKN